MGLGDSNNYLALPIKTLLETPYRYKPIGARSGTRTHNNQDLGLVRLPIAPPGHIREKWCPEWDSNPQQPTSEAGTSTNCVTWAEMKKPPSAFEEGF